jgi:hypothetical protein
MSRGGLRPGAGRKKGSRPRPVIVTGPEVIGKRLRKVEKLVKRGAKVLDIRALSSALGEEAVRDIRRVERLRRKAIQVALKHPMDERLMRNALRAGVDTTVDVNQTTMSFSMNFQGFLHDKTAKQLLEEVAGGHHGEVEGVDPASFADGAGAIRGRARRLAERGVGSVSGERPWGIEGLQGSGEDGSPVVAGVELSLDQKKLESGLHEHHVRQPERRSVVRDGEVESSESTPTATV